MYIPSPRPYDEQSAEAIPWHTTFIGQFMQHNYWIYSIIDRVMTENPQIQSIIEIGTGCGGITSVFGLWGVARGIKVTTIDLQSVFHNPIIFEKLGVEYLQLDVFDPVTEEEILKRIDNKPTWVFCDGGSKCRELGQFAPKIPETSIISAHDLGTEFIHDNCAKDLCDSSIIEPYHPEWWMEMNVQLALYKKL